MKIQQPPWKHATPSFEEYYSHVSTLKEYEDQTKDMDPLSAMEFTIERFSNYTGASRTWQKTGEEEKKLAAFEGLKQYAPEKFTSFSQFIDETMPVDDVIKRGGFDAEQSSHVLSNLWNRYSQMPHVADVLKAFPEETLDEMRYNTIQAEREARRDYFADIKFLGGYKDPVYAKALERDGTLSKIADMSGESIEETAAAVGIPEARLKEMDLSPSDIGDMAIRAFSRFGNNVDDPETAQLRRAVKNYISYQNIQSESDKMFRAAFNGEDSAELKSVYGEATDTILFSGLDRFAFSQTSGEIFNFVGRYFDLKQAQYRQNSVERAKEKGFSDAQPAKELSVVEKMASLGISMLRTPPPIKGLDASARLMQMADRQIAANQGTNPSTWPSDIAFAQDMIKSGLAAREQPDKDSPFMDRFKYITAEGTDALGQVGQSMPAFAAMMALGVPVPLAAGLLSSSREYLNHLTAEAGSNFQDDKFEADNILNSVAMAWVFSAVGGSIRLPTSVRIRAIESGGAAKTAAIATEMTADVAASSLISVGILAANPRLIEGAVRLARGDMADGESWLDRTSNTFFKWQIKEGQEFAFGKELFVAAIGGLPFEYMNAKSRAQQYVRIQKAVKSLPPDSTAEEIRKAVGAALDPKTPPEIRRSINKMFSSDNLAKVGEVFMKTINRIANKTGSNQRPSDIANQLTQQTLAGIGRNNPTRTNPLDEVPPVNQEPVEKPPSSQEPTKQQQQQRDLTATKQQQQQRDLTGRFVSKNTSLAEQAIRSWLGGIRNSKDTNLKRALGEINRVMDIYHDAKFVSRHSKNPMVRSSMDTASHQGKRVFFENEIDAVLFASMRRDNTASDRKSIDKILRETFSGMSTQEFSLMKKVRFSELEKIIDAQLPDAKDLIIGSEEFGAAMRLSRASGVSNELGLRNRKIATKATLEKEQRAERLLHEGIYKRLIEQGVNPEQARILADRKVQNMTRPAGASARPPRAAQEAMSAKSLAREEAAAAMGRRYRMANQLEESASTKRSIEKLIDDISDDRDIEFSESARSISESELRQMAEDIETLGRHVERVVEDNLRSRIDLIQEATGTPVASKDSLEAEIIRDATNRLIETAQARPEEISGLAKEMLSHPTDEPYVTQEVKRFSKDVMRILSDGGERLIDLLKSPSRLVAQLADMMSKDIASPEYAKRLQMMYENLDFKIQDHQDFAMFAMMHRSPWAERMYVAAVNADTGDPIAIKTNKDAYLDRSTVGGRRELEAWIAKVLQANPGKKIKIYSGHNHPSGNPRPGASDAKHHDALMEMLRNVSDAEYGGMMVTNGDQFAFVKPDQPVPRNPEELKSVLYNYENPRRKKPKLQKGVFVRSRDRAAMGDPSEADPGYQKIAQALHLANPDLVGILIGDKHGGLVGLETVPFVDVQQFARAVRVMAETTRGSRVYLVGNKSIDLLSATAVGEALRGTPARLVDVSTPSMKSWESEGLMSEMRMQMQAVKSAIESKREIYGGEERLVRAIEYLKTRANTEGDRNEIQKEQVEQVGRDEGQQGLQGSRSGVQQGAAKDRARPAPEQKGREASARSLADEYFDRTVEEVGKWAREPSKGGLPIEDLRSIAREIFGEDFLIDVNTQKKKVKARLVEDLKSELQAHHNALAKFFGGLKYISAIENSSVVDVIRDFRKFQETGEDATPNRIFEGDDISVGEDYISPGRPLSDPLDDYRAQAKSVNAPDTYQNWSRIGKALRKLFSPYHDMQPIILDPIAFLTPGQTPRGTKTYKAFANISAEATYRISKFMQAAQDAYMRLNDPVFQQRFPALNRLTGATRRQTQGAYSTLALIDDAVVRKYPELQRLKDFFNSDEMRSYMDETFNQEELVMVMTQEAYKDFRRAKETYDKILAMDPKRPRPRMDTDYERRMKMDPAEKLLEDEFVSYMRKSKNDPNWKPFSQSDEAQRTAQIAEEQARLGISIDANRQSMLDFDRSIGDRSEIEVRFESAAKDLDAKYNDYLNSRITMRDRNGFERLVWQSIFDAMKSVGDEAAYAKAVSDVFFGNVTLRDIMRDTLTGTGNNQVAIEYLDLSHVLNNLVIDQANYAALKVLLNSAVQDGLAAPIDDSFMSPKKAEETYKDFVRLPRLPGSFGIRSQKLAEQFIYHEAIGLRLSQELTRTATSGAVERWMGILKTASFGDPTYLGMMSVLQNLEASFLGTYAQKVKNMIKIVTGTDPELIPELHRSAAKHVNSMSEEYLAMMKYGGEASILSDRPETLEMRMDRASRKKFYNDPRQGSKLFADEYQQLRNMIRQSVEDFSSAKKEIVKNPAAFASSAARNLGDTLSYIAWRGDKIYRMETYLHFRRKGHSQEKAAELTRQIHAAYNNVHRVARSRQNIFAWVPSFLASMIGKTALQARSVLYVGAGYTPTKLGSALRANPENMALQKAYARSAINSMAMMGLSHMILQLAGWEAEKKFRKYTKPALDDKGALKPTSITISVPYSYGYRIIASTLLKDERGRNRADMIGSYLRGQMSPPFRVISSMFPPNGATPVDGDFKPLWKPNDGVAMRALKFSHELTKQIFSVYDTWVVRPLEERMEPSTPWKNIERHNKGIAAAFDLSMKMFGRGVFAYSSDPAFLKVSQRFQQDHAELIKEFSDPQLMPKTETDARRRILVFQKKLESYYGEFESEEIKLQKKWSDKALQALEEYIGVQLSIGESKQSTPEQIAYKIGLGGNKVLSSLNPEQRAKVRWQEYQKLVQESRLSSEQKNEIMKDMVQSPLLTQNQIDYLALFGGDQ